MKLFYTYHSSLVLLLVRIIPGLVFLSEGIQKFLFRETLGAGRFATLGFSHPEFWAGFTGVFEITCGILLITGFLARMATVPLLIVMMVAFISTKLPMLEQKGIWAMLHEGRADFAMVISLIIILLNGPGNWSLDQGIKRR
ncbi:MAG TPA: DoxX family protein [Puia sp.]